MSIGKQCLTVTPLNPNSIASLWEKSRKRLQHPATEKALEAVCLSHERLRAELHGAEVVIEDFKRLLHQIDLTLRVDAAEYVPAIRDVFTLIDKSGFGKDAK